MTLNYLLYSSWSYHQLGLDKVPVFYYIRNGVVMQKGRPPNVPASEEWSVVHQIVVLLYTQVRYCNWFMSLQWVAI